jgi:pimeloyl-ACP methyl ester carboxylesterase
MQLIYEAPTLGEFSRRVDDYRACNDPSEKHDFIYPLVETPNVTPLFFCLNDLSIARRWTVPCPLFHIAFWAKGSGFVQAGTLEGMAASHIDRIRKFQPRGPYRLAGYSMGGLVAYEMAQQLKAKGETVEFLFLLDPTAPLNAAGIKREWPNFRVGAHQDPFKDRFARHLRWIARGPRERGFRVWISKILFFHKLPCTPWAIYHLTHFFGRHPNRLSLALLPRDLWKAYMFVARRLIKNYVAEPYNGQVLAVFIESGTSADIWGPLLGPDAKMHKIEAEHGSLFKDPALDQWMGWLQDYVLHMHDKNF